MAAADFRDKLLACLGGPWPEGGPLEPKIEEVIPKDGYRLERLTFLAEPHDRIPALLLVPDRVTPARPAPGICIWHQHNGEWHLGKSEPAGLAGNPQHHTAVDLAREGYVVICPDALCFEDRRDPKLPGAAFERFEFLRLTVGGTCMAWKNILDMRRTVDYLVTRPEVKADRLGCYGHSMGSTHAWLVGPWEPRLKAIVGNCCLPTYAAIHRTKMLHCFPNFVPGLFAHGDTPDVAALIAPRALHLNFGETDTGSPIEEVRTGIETIRRAYESVHADAAFSSFIEPATGHVLSPEMRRRMLAFFNRHLRT